MPVVINEIEVIAASPPAVSSAKPQPQSTPHETKGLRPEDLARVLQRLAQRLDRVRAN